MSDLVKQVLDSEGSDVNALSALLEALSSETKQTVIDSIKEADILQFSSTLLAAAQDDRLEKPELAAEVLAKCLHDESVRGALSNGEFIRKIVKIITTIEFEDGRRRGLLQQLCRTLVNVSYQNESATDIVMECGGLEHLMKLIKFYAAVETPDKMFSAILMGCLSNMNESPLCRRRLVDNHMVPAIISCISKFEDPAKEHAATILMNLNEEDGWQGQVLAEKAALVRLLDGLTNEEVLDDLLGVLQTCFNDADDGAKYEFYKLGLWDRLASFVEEDLQRQKASDVMLVMLTDDKCMLEMFSGGKGAEYVLVKEWLRRESDAFRTIGALAIGNFARSDSLCMALLNDSVGGDLLKLVSPGQDVNILQAVLSALRNLLIPKPCKESLIQDGILDKLLLLLPIESYPVAFKFVGRLRMLADKQPRIAQRLGENEELLKHIVAFSKVQIHTGLQSEAMRVICWILKNNSADSVRTVMVSTGAVDVLIRLLQSEHVIMKNEAVIALSLLMNNNPTLGMREAFRESVNESFNQTISDILKTSVEGTESRKIAVEFVENVITLLLNFCIADKPLKEEMKSSHLEELKILSERTKHVRLKDKVCKLIHIMTVE